MKTIVLFSCFLLFFSEAFSQGKIDGFYRGKGNATAVVGLGFEDSKKYFAGTDKIDISRSLYYVNLYGSYGISDHLDVAISIPYLSSNKNSNLQDISLFLKHQVFQKNTESGNFQITVGAGFSTPISDYSVGGLNDIGQQATVFEGRALAHYFWKSGWFATIQSGYSLKLEETPNSIPITIKAGKAMAKWYYDFYYDYQHSFGGIDYLGTPEPQNFKELGSDFHKLGGSVYTSFSDTFGGFINLSYNLGGRNTFQGAAYGLGVVYNFKKKTD